ncbi:MAG TPA: M28 family peptidase [Vicinamibacterales bacterium]|nr:M28 family peptidase [Vicinamibacterales bacterium]
MPNRLRSLVLLILLLSLAAAAEAKSAKKKSAKAAPNPLVETQHACARCLRAHLDFLASDALRGRGSATPDETIAATYIAAQFELYGVPPASEKGYLQTAEIDTPKLAAPPTLSFTANNQTVTWTHGKEFILSRSSSKPASGPLQKLPPEGGQVKSGAVVLWEVDTNTDPRGWGMKLFGFLQSGAAAVMVRASKQSLEKWDSMTQERPMFTQAVVDAGPSSMRGIERDVVTLRPAAAQQLDQLPEGTTISLATSLGEPKREYTTNVVAIIHGTEPNADQDVILLTAHLDHLGMGTPANGGPNRKGPDGKIDNIYNGACDDASGTATVLDLARAIAAGPKPKRTVLFALFGSEELGGLGSTYFLSHSPVPLADITANLEFEMLAWPDPKLGHDQLWITGYDRTDFGPELARHGANLTADPYPTQQFFQRSDNYILAKKGVVAQTIGSFGLQKEYHSPDDDLAHVDWDHYVTAVDSLIAPVQWLINSSFKPQWLEGKKP